MNHKNVVLKAIIYDVDEIKEKAKEILADEDETDKSFRAGYSKGLIDAKILIKKYLDID